MGIIHDSKSSKDDKNTEKGDKINKPNKKDELGEEFILEDWEVYNDKNKNIDNTIIKIY